MRHKLPSGGPLLVELPGVIFDGSCSTEKAPPENNDKQLLSIK